MTTREEPALRPAAGEGKLVPGVRRIAVLRANALGDLVFALPALEALRAAYPAAEVVLVGRAWQGELLATRPSPIDRVVALPHPFIGDEAGPPPDPGAREAVLATLRAEGWDIAIQLHGGGANSNPIVAALGARVSAGSAAPGARSLDRTLPYVYEQHEVLRNLEVVGLVGARPVTVQPRLAVLEADRRAAGGALGRLARQPYVVLHPGASDPRRRWPVESFAAVGRTLAARGLGVVVTGTPAEGRLTRELTVRLGEPPLPVDSALDLAGGLELPALVGVLAGSALVITNDTGPLHLADAVGARTVGIFWCGNLVTAGPVGRARHRPVVAWRLACPTCGVDCTTGRCGHEASFVADVPVAAVLDAALTLLDDPGRRG